VHAHGTHGARHKHGLRAAFALTAAFLLVEAAVGFWTVDSRGFANTFTYAGNKLTQYPLDVFAGWLRRLVLIIPLAFVNYLPAARLLDRRPAYDLPPWLPKLLFLGVGIWWMVRAFVLKAATSAWWLDLVAGMMMIVLAFWTSGQFFFEKAYTLLVFAGIWALMHGITDIVRAFQVRGLRDDL